MKAHLLACSESEQRPVRGSCASIVSFIWDANGDRRDMSKGAKAMLAALGPGIQSSLSENAGVSSGYLGQARAVIQWCDDDMQNDVIADRLPLDDAYTRSG